MIDGTYYHTQRGPWGLMCYAFAVAFVVASLSRAVPALQITFLVTGLFILLIGVSIGHLTIEDGLCKQLRSGRLVAVIGHRCQANGRAAE